MGDKLFAVVFPIQQAQIEYWCWGEHCGRGVCGAIDLGRFSCVPCNCPECPHVEKEMAESCGEVQGRKVYLRKLKPVPVDVRR